MKLAVISAVRDSWDGTPAFLTELRALLGKNSDIDASLWLLDDFAAERPQSWHSLDAAGGELHVIELQGQQGRDRAFAAALGYLLCEREAAFDAFLLLDVQDPKQLRKLGPLFEASFSNPDAVVLAPGGAGRSGLFSGFRYRLGSVFLRALSGERLTQSPAILLPASAAEALCHTCHGASHLEAALRRLRVSTVPAAMAGSACGLDVIAAASVFRDRVFDRAFRFASWLFVFTLLLAGAAAVELARGAGVPALSLAVLALSASVFGGAAIVALLFGIFSRSLNEARRWTPALDASLLIREVTRVKRQPYSLSGSA